MTSDEELQARVPGLVQRLNGTRTPLAEKFRALFALKAIGGAAVIEGIGRVFGIPDEALLKHECAYCLGQMKDTVATPTLVKVLKDVGQDSMVRHEAAEAIAAIGDMTQLDLLREYCKDPNVHVAETCEIAVAKLVKDQVGTDNQFGSEDPAPAASSSEPVESHRATFLDESAPLYTRYKSMFALRNRADDEGVLALVEGLKASSALFRHEVAFVLGQLAHPLATEGLYKTLKIEDEADMVRHECAEALGAIATPQCISYLKEFVTDRCEVVKQSCIIALDMADYSTSDQFQYAG